jgi:hypothetical protein
VEWVQLKLTVAPTIRSVSRNDSMIVTLRIQRQVILRIWFDCIISQEAPDRFKSTSMSSLPVG